MLRLLVSFFSQFLPDPITNSDECIPWELLSLLRKKNYLIKYMLKLPEILKRDSTLSSEKCRQLFDNKHRIDHQLQSSHQNLLADPLYAFVGCLHDYISFLINANLAKETKRKILSV
jgi:hypothetical protein